MDVPRRRLTPETAVQQVLDGTISDKGILAPMNSKINGPLMRVLKDKYGFVVIAQQDVHADEIRIFCKEKVIR
jgi:hypothetical protein